MPRHGDVGGAGARAVHRRGRASRSAQLLDSPIRCAPCCSPRPGPRRWRDLVDADRDRRAGPGRRARGAQGRDRVRRAPRRAGVGGPDGVAIGRRVAGAGDDRGSSSSRGWSTTRTSVRIFRTSAALGIGAVLLDDLCADPLYRRSVRVSLGHVLHAPPRADRIAPRRSSGDPASLRASDRRAHPGAGSADGRTTAPQRRGLLDDPVALVLGAEGPGLDPGVIAAADVSVRVPMAHGVDSLNVATTLGVVASFAAARRGWDRLRVSRRSLSPVAARRGPPPSRARCRRPRRPCCRPTRRRRRPNGPAPDDGSRW